MSTLAIVQDWRRCVAGGYLGAGHEGAVAFGTTYLHLDPEQFK